VRLNQEELTIGKAEEADALSKQLASSGPDAENESTAKVIGKTGESDHDE
jgi:hypothetical protein